MIEGYAIAIAPAVQRLDDTAGNGEVRFLSNMATHQASAM